MRNITISGLLSIFKSTYVCAGPELNSKELVLHYIPDELDLEQESENPQQAKKYTMSVEKCHHPWVWSWPQSSHFGFPRAGHISLGDVLCTSAWFYYVGVTIVSSVRANT